MRIFPATLFQVPGLRGVFGLVQPSLARGGYKRFEADCELKFLRGLALVRR
jgi:hypothetical protein